jgi:glycosyltransferase involved in cell wall biosynthesis
LAVHIGHRHLSGESAAQACCAGNSFGAVAAMTRERGVGHRKALLIHGDVYGFGGAENHCIRVAQIMQNAGFDVTVLHGGGPLDVERIWKWCGIRLDPARASFVTAEPFTRFPSFLAGKVLLRYAFVLRAARRIVDEFEIVIGTFGEVPLELQTLIQSTHVPLFFCDPESLSYLGFDSGRSRLRYWMRVVYVRAARRIAGWSRRVIESQRLLTNSYWTARQFQRHYPRSNPKVIYHGARTDLVQSDNDYLAFGERTENFVILGRIAPSKRVELAIEIVDLLRGRGWGAGLTIIGSNEGRYADSIASLVNDRPYVKWRQNLARGDVEKLVASHKWGLHCAPNEHYGLAAIEMLRLGCIVFVPDSGGQAEVVSDERLRYTSALDAADKIERVLRSDALQAELRVLLAEIGRLHTVEMFMESFTHYVFDVLGEG